MKRIGASMFFLALPVYASEEAKIVETVRMMFVALQNEDAGKFRSVTSPEAHIHGSTAWITCINRGSIEDKSGKQILKWLESAFQCTSIPFPEVAIWS